MSLKDSQREVGVGVSPDCIHTSLYYVYHSLSITSKPHVVLTMPFITSVRRALPAAILFTTFASAQSCWYPDGKTLASDTACNPNATVSACCGSASYCLNEGLCITGGVVTRGSCTDKTWGSAECAQFCKTGMHILPQLIAAKTMY